MHSPVNWALLGLVIDRPSYAYELAQRFERTYGSALPLSSVSHAYAALGTLKDRELIEELPATKTGRQPKPHYRATVRGMEEYHAWLIGQVADERRRQKVFLLQLTTLARDPCKAMQILDDYEQACLDSSCTTPIAGGANGAPGSGLELQAKLIAEEKRLAVGAKIEWARYARGELKAFASARTHQADGQAGDPADERVDWHGESPAGGQAGGASKD
jgi:DNA-binding PadR family transcriptional regulator